MVGWLGMWTGKQVNRATKGCYKKYNDELGEQATVRGFGDEDTEGAGVDGNFDGGRADGFGIYVDGEIVAVYGNIASAVMLDVGLAVEKTCAEADEMPKGVRGVVAVEEGDVEKSIVYAGVGREANHRAVELGVAGESKEDTAAISDAVYFDAHGAPAVLEGLTETDGKEKEFAKAALVVAVLFDCFDDGGIESDTAAEEEGAGGKPFPLRDAYVYGARWDGCLEPGGAHDIIQRESHFERPDVGSAERKDTDGGGSPEDTVGDFVEGAVAAHGENDIGTLLRGLTREAAGVPSGLRFAKGDFPSEVAQTCIYSVEGGKVVVHAGRGIVDDDCAHQVLFPGPEGDDTLSDFAGGGTAYGVGNIDGAVVVALAGSIDERFAVG